MKDFKEYQKQYFSDPAFHAVVDNLTNLITKCELSPQEIRNAAMFAIIKFQIENQKPITF